MRLICLLALLLELCLAANSQAFAEITTNSSASESQGPTELAPKPGLRLFSHLNPWLASLEPIRRKQVLDLFLAHEPKLLELQQKIHQKVAELRSLRYAINSSPNALPKLGRELLKLREDFRQEIHQLSLKLKAELGYCPKLWLKAKGRCLGPNPKEPLPKN
ncbi:MAG: hypothetical protein IJS50_01930 [Desulfovibrio sp.]|nr:hypothetical protein [Desulfovibrio sp.]